LVTLVWGLFTNPIKQCLIELLPLDRIITGKVLARTLLVANVVSGKIPVGNHCLVPLKVKDEKVQTAVIPASFVLRLFCSLLRGTKSRACVYY
jgi:hypothetical protein